MTTKLSDKLTTEEMSALSNEMLAREQAAYNKGLDEGKGYWVRLAAGAWRSRTNKVAALTIAAGGVYEFLPQVRDMLNPDAYGLILSALGVAMMALRAATGKPLTER